MRLCEGVSFLLERISLRIPSHGLDVSACGGGWIVGCARRVRGGGCGACGGEVFDFGLHRGRESAGTERVSHGFDGPRFVHRVGKS